MKKKCNRKVRPLINPIAYALSGAAMIPDADLVGLRTRELAAIEAFRTGGAGLQEWADVNSMLTMCEVMARCGVGSEALPTCEAARTHSKQPPSGLSRQSAWEPMAQACRHSVTCTNTTTCKEPQYTAASMRSSSDWGQITSNRNPATLKKSFELVSRSSQKRHF